MSRRTEEEVTPKIGSRHHSPSTPGSSPRRRLDFGPAEEESMLFVDSPDLRADFQRWHDGGVSQFRVALDVGGTNARVAFLPLPRKSGGIRVKMDGVGLLKKGVPDDQCGAKLLIRLLHEFAAIAEEVFGPKPAECACIAIAGPVPPPGSPVNMSNFQVNKEFTREQLPASLFPREDLTWILNDMVAGGYGLIAVSKRGGHTELGAERTGLHRFFHSTDYFTGARFESSSLSSASAFVINLGTGLGTNYLKYFDPKTNPEVRGACHVPDALETGHMQPFVGPDGASKLVEEYIAMKNDARGIALSEVEDTISGDRGWTHVFYAYRDLGLIDVDPQSPRIRAYLDSLRDTPDRSAAEVREELLRILSAPFTSCRVLKGDVVGDVLHLFPQVQLHVWSKVFYVARQFATQHPSTKTVILMGNNASRPRTQEFFDRKQAKLRGMFFDKSGDTQSTILEGVSCYIPLSLDDRPKVNFNVLGACEYMAVMMRD